MKKHLSEFSKTLPFFSNLMFFIWITWSYILASYGLDTNSTVTVAIVSQCIATNLGYYTYQGCLKNSTNKYATDKDGVPYSSKDGVQ